MLCVVPMQIRAFCRSLRSPEQGTGTVSIPPSPVHLKLRKRLRFCAYKIQYLRKCLEEDYAGRQDVLSCFGILLPKQKLVFVEETSLHIAVCVNRCCCRVRFQENCTFLWTMKDAFRKYRPVSGPSLHRTGLLGL